MAPSNSLRALTVHLLTAATLFAGTSDKPRSGDVSKTTTNDDYRAFTINNLFNYYANNGDGSYNKYTSNGALEFPKGSGKTVMFEDGVVWGGFHKGEKDPKVGGSVYRHGLQAGPILTPGSLTADPVAADPLDPKYHIYRVRTDVGPKSNLAAVQSALQEELTLLNRYESETVQSLYDSYVRDWNEWPAKSGTNPTGLAPFWDVDGNGLYDPNIDIPGQPGSDQTLYYVANDCNKDNTVYLAGCNPIGLEVHRTFWGYNRAGYAGNIIFCSTILINKSGAPVDSMFLALFSDPDIGDAGDDFVGCDRSRNLGFAYNGRVTDATYGVAVPSPGYRVLQGPMVPGSPSDSAVLLQQVRPGFRNLPMTSFALFSSGFTSYADPAQGNRGNIEWYWLMNGLTSKAGASFINPVTNQPTKFVCDGDPVTRQGWVDGMAGLTPQDRRLAMATGPFTMANGDTQELVVANVVDVGADRLSSISLMKRTSDAAQNIYDYHFSVANPPPVRFTATGLHQEVVLDWADPASYLRAEGYWGGGYHFQGYNVYQLPGPAFESKNALRLATYDLKDSLGTIFDDVYDDRTGYLGNAAVQFGTNSGIRRSYNTETNALNGQRLVDGTTYYYAVTAYAVHPGPPVEPRQIESSPMVLAVIPQTPPPGFRTLAFGDTIKDVTHFNNSGPLSDGNLTAIVVDPTQLTGATYKVIFEGESPNQTWSLIRMLGGSHDTLVKGLRDQSGTVEGAPTIDGVQWRLLGYANDFKRFLAVANAGGPLNPFDMGTFAINGNGFPTLDGATPNNMNDRPSARQQLGGGKWGICTGNDAYGNPSYSHFLQQTTRETDRGVGGNWPRITPYDFEIRFTPAGGKAKLAFTTGSAIDVPFELWNIGTGTPDDRSDDYRMIPWLKDVNNDGKFGLDGIDHLVSGGDDDPETDWIFWMDPMDRSPGHAGYDAWVNSNFNDSVATGPEVMAKMVLVNLNGGSVSAANFPDNVNQRMPETGTVFRILTRRPNHVSDEFFVTAPAYKYSAALAAEDIVRINVYPNPYFGYNPLETDKYHRFVTFTHLPQKAVLRIFDLGGTLVRTLVKDDASQFVRWDLENENHYLVGSAIYVVHIQMPDLGKTKILKVAVIQEQQWMDRW